MATSAFILILTPDEASGQELRERLRESFGHQCTVVNSLDDALESVRARMPDAVVVKPDEASLPSLAPLAEHLNRGGGDTALITVGVALPDDLAELPAARLNADQELRRVAQEISDIAVKAAARRADRQLQQTIAGQKHEAFEGIVGVSRPIQKIVERIKKAARSKVVVLVLGETGTGKDLIAEAIHRRSDRSGKTFRALNCAAVNENLLDSTLFGHVRGAFTGAVAENKGYFVAADGGTLFLDEIGDTPISMQAKLLRVLDRREVTPVGSTEIRRVDVRLIAATNVDLLREVEEGNFRKDLYYRLNQLVIQVPPLRERREDIPLLADHFRQRANRTHGMSCEGISSEAMGLLAKYYWPGNVRELANVVEAAVVEVEERQIEADDLPERIRGSREIVPAGASGMVGLTMAQVERMMIEKTLQATSGNREQAAKILDIGTRTLYRKIKEYGL
jgi:transcriptional regulator with PAS, ATPase and Fis domain